MLSAIYVLHRPDHSLPFLRTDLLISRQYHNDVPSSINVLEPFCETLLQQNYDEVIPFVEINGAIYVFISCDNDILFLGLTRQNLNAMLTVTYLHRLQEVLRQYLCNKPSELNSTKSVLDKKNGWRLDRDSISDNSHVIHELFDECMDFGVIQNTDYNILKEYIKVEVNKSSIVYNGESLSSSDSSDSSDDEHIRRSAAKAKKAKKKRKSKKTKEIKDVRSTHNQAVNAQVLEQEVHINSSILRSSSLAISWRPKGIFYAKNEIYIDIIEETVFYYDLQTKKIKFNETNGRCDVKCFLSGLPKCKVGFNESRLSRINSGDDIPISDIKSVSDIEGNQLKMTEEDDDVEEKLNLEPNSGTDEHKNISNISNESKESEESNESNESLGFHIPLRNIQFHQCIELGSIYQDQLVYFTPPDDKFTLLEYTTDLTRKRPLFMLEPTYQVDQKNKTLKVMCSLSCNFKKRLKTQNLIVRLPIDPNIFTLPKDNQMKFKAQVGSVSFKIDTSELYWNIGEIAGHVQSVKMVSEVILSVCPNEDDIHKHFNRHSLLNNLNQDNGDTDIDSDEENNSGSKELDKLYGVNQAGVSEEQDVIVNKKGYQNEIKLIFEIPMLSYSGLKLTYLSVIEEQMNYTSFPWVRYRTECKSANSEYRFKLGANNFDVR